MIGEDCCSGSQGQKSSICFKKTAQFQPLFSTVMPLISSRHPSYPLFLHSPHPSPPALAPRRLWWAAPPWFWLWFCPSNTAPCWTPMRSAELWRTPRPAVTTLYTLGLLGGDQRWEPKDETSFSEKRHDAQPFIGSVFNKYESSHRLLMQCAVT